MQYIQLSALLKSCEVEGIPDCDTALVRVPKLLSHIVVLTVIVEFIGKVESDYNNHVSYERKHGRQAPEGFGFPDLASSTAEQYLRSSRAFQTPHCDHTTTLPTGWRPWR